MSSDDEQVDESSECQVSVSSKGARGGEVIEMQPHYNGHLIMPEAVARGNNSDLDSITRSNNNLTNMTDKQQHFNAQDSHSSRQHQ